MSRKCKSDKCSSEYFSAVDSYESNISEYEIDLQASIAREGLLKSELAKANGSWSELRKELAESSYQLSSQRHAIRNLQIALDALTAQLGDAIKLRDIYCRQVQASRRAEEALHKALYPGLQPTAARWEDVRASAASTGLLGGNWRVYCNHCGIPHDGDCLRPTNKGTVRSMSDNGALSDILSDIGWSDDE